ncbi:MAG: VOC family protein [Acidimicrobiales bacterium]
MPTAQRNPQFVSDPAEDDRPRFGIGHVSMTAADVDAMSDFYTAIGMRLVVNMGRASILELRGGTHLVIHSGESGVGNLDLIVDDIEETRSILEAEGASPSTIQRGNPHDRFTATDPEGNTLVVNSDHSIGAV